ncbi:MAG: polyphosphate polymerase domain-containing protein [Clostridia bacterium]|nr:polyphosphate polymerase domain-containing protein [Clostridia bacterium]
MNGRYYIHSLYFDDYKDTSIYTTNSGLSKRFKWRIRYYGDDLSYIRLEKKEKVEGRCHKKSCKIIVDEYNKIVSGDVTDLVFETEKDLIKELAVDILIHNYKPKVIIDYERIAYVEEITNVRVTFDMKISASYELENFLDGDYQSFYVLPSGLNVLEVKFDNILPSHIRNIVESYSLKQGSFSKYYYGRRILDCYMR